MRVDELAPAPGSTHPKKRVGRGIGGKGGKTAGRGTKGQQSRGRGKVARGFEGGQMPLKQRVPKLKGFNNPFRIEYQGVNLDTINELEDALVNPEVLTAAGVLHKNVFVKVLGRGQITRKVLSIAIERMLSPPDPNVAITFPLAPKALSKLPLTLYLTTEMSPFIVLPVSPHIIIFPSF